jgi:hypothetical protein
MISRRAVLISPVVPVASALCHAHVSDRDTVPAQSSDGGRPQLLRQITAIPTVHSTRTTIVLGTDKDTWRLNVISAEE